VAIYRAIVDLYLPGGQYAQAGDTLSDVGLGVPVPVGWVPPLGVDPISTDAVQAFFNAGPTAAMGSAEHGGLSIVLAGNRWSDRPVAPPNHYWRPVMQGGHRVWVVNAAEALGYRDDL
jgi:hypothetical protein